MISQYKLTADQTQCLKSCAACEQHLNGFIRIHGGELLISDFFLNLYGNEIACAVEECPAQAIRLDLV